ncbi:DUF5018 domain-containing protein [uncultured Bacteroides sp.]|uniref:DUF5018 domain-containing protein n=1 Tax=uncultured Bacteroides sp. TaxID=162156 RepID=UPI002AAAC2E5|nr:DUF5018 domain-containing protein [uncultured Bacteroides sp.]
MKKNIFILLIGVISTMSGCQSPDELSSTAQGEGLNSITAYFAEGTYKDDQQAAFKTTVTDLSSDIVVQVPYYYPEETDLTTTITKMRLVGEFDSNCSIEPKLGVVDLTKKNYYTFTNARGEKKQISITGKIALLTGCDITYFAIPDDEANGITGVTGVIDQDSRTISLITIQDLSSVKVNLKISPHSTISPDPRVTALNLNQETKLTVTAHDGVTKKEYTITKAAPEKIGYGFRSGSQQKLFEFDFTNNGIDWLSSNNPSLAAIGSNLILCTGNGVIPTYFNRITGAKIGQITLGSAKADGCITNDLGGNLLICDYAATGNTFNIYRTNAVNKAPVLFLSYDNSTGSDLGAKVSVQGNIDSNAIISAELANWGGSKSFVRWIVKNGSIGNPEVITMSGTTAWSSGVTVADLVYATTNVTDGYFTSFYDADVLHYMDGSTNASVANLQPQSDGSGWAYNNNCLDVKQFNGARYLALGCISHFPQWAINTQIYLYDVTSTSQFSGPVDTSGALVFSPTVTSFLTAGDGISAMGDVLLVPSVDGYNLTLYYIDNNCKVLGAYQFDCIKK